ncbi:hypothetical protein ACFFQF_05315 [Haladaptatus pallidirubidus]|uniref:hypothetical protein n=1 Tax=Haladaptatus pallidirubidus TaxID=1008152 RepID=UPI0035E47E41
MESPATSRRGFVAFYRRYTKTWLHALATASLTAFGMLTFVHRGFAIVAVTTYVIPPIVLYLREADGRDVESTVEETEPTITDNELTTGADSTASRNSAVGRSSETGTIPSVETGSEPANGESNRRSDAELASSDSDDADDTDADAPEKPRWTTAETPTEAVLSDVVVTDARAFALGEGGVVLAADGTDAEWRVVLDDGPGADGFDLRSADASDDGAVWFAGDGGSLGCLDPETGRHTDYSAPSRITDNWTDIAVSGTGDDATILLVNGSGQVLRGRYRDGNLAWGDPEKPGSGSSLCAVTLANGVGYCCDTNDSVFETTDGGETFERIGIESVDGTLTAIGATARGDCAAIDDAGVLHRYDDGNWTPKRLGDDPPGTRVGRVLRRLRRWWNRSRARRRDDRLGTD